VFYFYIDATLSCDPPYVLVVYGLGHRYRPRSDQTSKQIADLSISTQNLPVAVHWQKCVDETSLHSAIARLLLHYRMTSFLAYAVKSVRFQDPADLVSGKNAELKHGLPQNE
jgi:hypothetical protein